MSFEAQERVIYDTFELYFEGIRIKGIHRLSPKLFDITVADELDLWFAIFESERDSGYNVDGAFGIIMPNSEMRAFVRFFNKRYGYYSIEEIKPGRTMKKLYASYKDEIDPNS